MPVYRVYVKNIPEEGDEFDIMLMSFLSFVWEKEDLPQSLSSRSFLAYRSHMIHDSTMHNCRHFKLTHMYCVLMTATREDLKAIFNQYGRVLTVRLHRDRSTGKGNVTYNTEVRLIVFSEIACVLRGNIMSHSMHVARANRCCYGRLWYNFTWKRIDYGGLSKGGTLPLRLSA